MTQRTAIQSLSPLRRTTNPLTSINSWPSEAVWVWTEEILQLASHSIEIETIVASGSAVRDVEHSEDLDLVLVYEATRPTLSRPPIDVDLRQYEKSEVSERLQSGHEYLFWTLRFGRVLFDRNGWWERLSTDWAQRIPLPCAVVARERAGKVNRLYREMAAIGDHEAAAELRLSLLTHMARAALSDAGVFPKSRPELPQQLRDISEQTLADRLSDALAQRIT